MTQLLDSARTFIVGNARLLERRRYEYLFADGGHQPVLAALLGYQNPDGGFGNALEPDKRTGTSQPIDQELALRFLDEIDGEREVALRICDFLQTITTAEGGVPFVLPTVRDAPRAEWWNTESDEPPATINPTASIAGLLYKLGVEHPWLDRATAFCWRQIEDGELGGHDFFCVLHFLEHVPDRQRAEQAFERVSRQLLDSGLVALDPAAEGYVFMPLDFAPAPSNLARRLFDDATIEKHLDALESRQQPDGGWPIAWPPVSPGCELEYRGIVTVNALKTLQAYGRLKAKNLEPRT
ncbi:MAG TPA: hypothetical protein VGD58_27055 [Herpetosiphonaceae bacterium]